ncbi:MAG: hypothetical protein GX363_00210 [Clostridiales bacterium]|nr:hypothetical protein [Clostridiales bacterium]
MKCGVRFCGGCNPRYDRGRALEKIKDYFKDRIEFSYAKEDVDYDILLVIGGCTNNCASFSQFNSKLGSIKMWSEDHIDKVIEELEGILLKSN